MAGPTRQVLSPAEKRLKNVLEEAQALDKIEDIAILMKICKWIKSYSGSGVELRNDLSNVDEEEKFNKDCEEYENQVFEVYDNVAEAEAFISTLTNTANQSVSIAAAEEGNANVLKKLAESITQAVPT